MDRPILVPVDGTSFAERALPHALELARASGSSIHLARVHSLAFGGGASRIAPSLRSRWAADLGHLEQLASDYLHATAARVAQVLGTSRVRVSLLKNAVSIPDALTQHARRIRAGAVVIATQDRAPLARLAWLSVADGLIRRSGLPVTVVTPQTLPRGLGAPVHMLLPIADLPGNEGALRVAAAFARQCGARVTLAMVMNAGTQREPMIGLGSADAHRDQGAAMDELDAAAELISGAVPVDVRVESDRSVAHGILRLARETRAGLIVMPTRRRGGMEALLGSTASEVLRSSELPVTVIGAAAGPRPEARNAEPVEEHRAVV